MCCKEWSNDGVFQKFWTENYNIQLLDLSRFNLYVLYSVVWFSFLVCTSWKPVNTTNFSQQSFCRLWVCRTPPLVLTLLEIPAKRKVAILVSMYCSIMGGQLQPELSLTFQPEKGPSCLISGECCSFVRLLCLCANVREDLIECIFVVANYKITSDCTAAIFWVK